mmetsp:Transcript_41243/g.89940  ORF Transcript_41243/g.89940 Transcript_41243/m.89940 type:complete len:435 (-) Transcript_41243:192-1496(-)
MRISVVLMGLLAGQEVDLASLDKVINGGDQVESTEVIAQSNTTEAAVASDQGQFLAKKAAEKISSSDSVAQSDAKDQGSSGDSDEDADQSGDDSRIKQWTNLDAKQEQWSGGAGNTNYKDGFNGVVLRRPNYHGITKPVITNNKFEESMLRAHAAQTIERVLREQRPKLLTHLRKQSNEAGAKFSRTATSIESKAAAKRSWNIGKTLLENKAFADCGVLSRMRKLPAMCVQDAMKLWDKVDPESQTKWAPAAARKSQKLVKEFAADAAYLAVSHFPTKRMPPAAYQRARRVFAKQWPIYVQKYDKMADTSLQKMEKERKKFWSDAQKDMEKKVEAEVMKAIWGEPVKRATLLINRVAQRQAHRTSHAQVTNILAPKFVAAAKIALTKGVRSAHTAAVHDWKPDWALPPRETTGRVTTQQLYSEPADAGSWDWER